MTGSTCTLLTPAIKAKLHELRTGQILEVRVDDPTAREDIASWCRLTGHELLAVSEETPHQLRCYIRKKT
jgi:tRNA 2-thiouridine synthesizing protein A